MAVVRPGLEGICLSMPMGPEDVALCAAIVAEAEDRNGVASGSVRLLPALETPRSLQLAYEIAQHPRVDYQIGRASCRERVCQYVSITVVAASLKKKLNTY